MFEDATYAQSLLRVHAKQPPDQVFGVFRDFLLHVVLGVEDLLMQVFHVIGFEGYCAKEKSEKDDSCAPQIRPEPPVAFIFNDLWCDVGWSATLFVHDFTRFDGLRDAKIGNFNQAFAVKENIVQFDVPMQDRLRVNVADAFDDLLKKDLGKRLLALFTLPHEVEKITARAQLHDQHDVTLSLECLVQLHHGGMSQSKQDSHLVHNLHPLLVVSQVLLINRFNSD